MPGPRGPRAALRTVPDEGVPEGEWPLVVYESMRQGMPLFAGCGEGAEPPFDDVLTLASWIDAPVHRFKPAGSECP